MEAFDRALSPDKPPLWQANNLKGANARSSGAEANDATSLLP